MDINLKNGYIMVKAEEQKEEESTTASGIIIPEEKMEEDQVAKGTIVAVCEELKSEYAIGDKIFFHKTMPIDVHLKFDSDELEEFWFIKDREVICTYNVE